MYGHIASLVVVYFNHPPSRSMRVLLRVDLKTFLTLEALTYSLFQQTKRIVHDWCYLIGTTQKKIILVFILLIIDLIE